MRNTDGHFTNFIEQAYEHIKIFANNRFFICSDNKNTEDQFCKLANVITYTKTHYVEKINSNVDWNQSPDSNSCNTNVMRNSESVIQGFIDMLILSRTNIISPDVGSTFLQFSKLYSHIEF